MSKKIPNEDVYYKGLTTTDGRFLVDKSKPFDEFGNPLANPEIVDGIELKSIKGE